MSDKLWTCPFCNCSAILRERDSRSLTFEFRHPLLPEEKRTALLFVEFCPNERCKKTTLGLQLWRLRRKPGVGEQWDMSMEREWSLVPDSKAKPFPSYIPNAIFDDYREACLIATLSPKASATLARRCLQGMIRDFWGISKRRLKDEVDALEEKVNLETWEAIDGVRKIGNIGAHMEADINVIVDVDPDEAELLIGLIETLLFEWYVG